MARLYEYAIWVDEKLNKDGEVTEPAAIIREPTVVIARDERTVGMRAAREIPSEYDDKLDRVQVSIRPF